MEAVICVSQFTVSVINARVPLILSETEEKIQSAFSLLSSHSMTDGQVWRTGAGLFCLFPDPSQSVIYVTPYGMDSHTHAHTPVVSSQ